MDVSVIIPVYNMESFIEQGISTVEAQTLKDIEIIMVDDGSKDNSGEMCDAAAKKFSNIRVMHTRNQGAGPARNAGIDSAQGDYLYFFDIDDAMAPNALEVLVRTARENSSDIVVCAYCRKNENEAEYKVIARKRAQLNGSEVRRNYDKYMDGDYGIQGAPWNKLFRRALVKEHSVEYPDLRRGQDEIFTMRVMNYAEKISIIDDALYYYLANTNERILSKFQLEYDENVRRQLEYFQMIISWNPENTEMKRILGERFYINMLISMKVVFNPKWKLSFFRGFREIKKRHAAYLAGCARYGNPEDSDEIRRSNYWPLIKMKASLPLYVVMLINTARRLRAGD